MERFFILDKYNTWYNWRLILTAKDVTPPEPKTNYVELDGMSGSLDLTEALSGEVTFADRNLSASFWTDEGTRKDRETLRTQIITALHGRKVKIIDPDDPEHFFNGRVSVKSWKNILPYAELSIEATCEPWRYALEESKRRVDVTGSSPVDIVIQNHGVKTLCPSIRVDGSVTISYKGSDITLTDGTYRIPEIKLRSGANIVTLSGDGSIAFTYREAIL